jgi:hypothetical protein
MRRFIVAAVSIAALAVPAVSMADAPGATGVSTHNNPNAVIGYDVSAGNYNYLNGNDPSGQTSTGQNRSALNAAQGPGAVANLIAAARADTQTGQYGTFPPPGQ